MSTSSSSSDDKHTIIEEGTEFKGSLTSTCPVDVRGRIDGDVASPALTVGPTGSVRGSAKVGTLRSQGDIAGIIEAETVELAGTVRDESLIRARTLDVKLASADSPSHVVFDDCELEIGEVKSTDSGRGGNGGGKGKRRKANRVTEPEIARNADEGPPTDQAPSEKPEE